MSSALPLSGRLVLEISRPGASEVTARAIALAGRIACDLGADVVKLEPVEGCRLRRTPPFVAGADGEPVSAAHVFLDGGKRSVRLSAGDEGRAVQAALVARAAAVLTDDKEVLDGIASSVGLNRAVVVHVAHGLPADCGIDDALVTDTSILAASGILDLVGDPNHAPIPLGGHQASYVAGLAAFSGLVTGLVLADRGEACAPVRVSAVEACLWSNWKSFAERLYMGQSPTRQGRNAEWQALPCADGFAAFVYLDKDWPAIVRLIGDDRLAAPPLDTRAGRRAHMIDVLAIVGPWYRARTRADIYRLAKAAGLPIAPVLEIAEVVADPQFVSLAFFAGPAAVLVDDRARVPTLPVRWDDRRFPARTIASEVAP